MYHALPHALLHPSDPGLVAGTDGCSLQLRAPNDRVTGPILQGPNMLGALAFGSRPTEST